MFARDPDLCCHLFDTAIGPCGIAWGPFGIVGLQLPEADAAATAARLRRHHAALRDAAPTADIAAAVTDIRALLTGDKRDLQHLLLDMRGVPPFHQRVYAAVRRIGPGHTRTYGDIAHSLAEPGAARAVGQALGANPFALIVPCHRILAAAAKPGGFSAGGGVATKFRLLEIEGAGLGRQLDLF
jgi:methylated-DNA-[protein]-cysteine S-methyltransferase